MSNDEEDIVLLAPPAGAIENGYGNPGKYFTGDVSNIPNIATHRAIKINFYSGLQNFDHGGLYAIAWYDEKGNFLKQFGCFNSNLKKNSTDGSLVLTIFAPSYDGPYVANVPSYTCKT